MSGQGLRIPVIDLLFREVFLVPIALHQFLFELLAMAGDLPEVIESELTPLISDPVLALIPVLLNPVAVYCNPSFALLPRKGKTKKLELCSAAAFRRCEGRMVAHGPRQSRFVPRRLE